MLLNSYSYSENAVLRSLPLQQLDKTLTPWRSLPRSRPSGGWLRAVLKLRDPGLELMKTDPLLDPLRKDPRYNAIVRELKFPD